tara:strand:+ start:470 stop:745 length:276 start_codon:yes stop_codon:yes gene_type:complete
MSKYKYNYENATEKRESQLKEGRLDIPHTTPDNCPQHLQEHQMLQEIQHEALYGEVKRVKELLSTWPESKQQDLRKLLLEIVEERGRTLLI